MQVLLINSEQVEYLLCESQAFHQIRWMFPLLPFLSLSSPNCISSFVELYLRSSKSGGDIVGVKETLKDCFWSV